MKIKRIECQFARIFNPMIPVFLLTCSIACHNRDARNDNQFSNDRSKQIKKIEISLQTTNGFCRITPDINDSVFALILDHLFSADLGFPADLIREIAIIDSGRIKRTYVDTTRDMHKNIQQKWHADRSIPDEFDNCGCEAPEDSFYAITGKDTIIYVLFCGQVMKTHNKRRALLSLSERESDIIQCIWEVVRNNTSNSSYGCSSDANPYPFVTSDIYVNGSWRVSRRFCDISDMIERTLRNEMDSTRIAEAIVKVPLTFRNGEFKIGEVVGENLNDQITNKITAAILEELNQRVAVEIGDTIRVTYTDFALLYGK